MNKSAKIISILTLLLSSPFLVGCWDRTEVNDIAIAVASAVDKESDKQVRFSAQIPLPSQMGGISGGGGGTSGKKSFYVDSETGKTVREAITHMQSRMSRKLFFSHRRVLVIGEEMARDGIVNLFDVAARVPENRVAADLVIAKGKGIDLLNAQPNFEKYSGEAMREILESETVLGTTIRNAAQMLNKSGSDALIPYMGVVQSKGGKDKSQEVQLLGYAIFRNDKMVGTIQGKASEGIRWLKSDFHPYAMTFETPDGPVSVSIYKGSVKIKPKLMSDHVEFDIKIKTVAYMLESVPMVDLVRANNVNQYEQKMKTEIEKSIREAAGELQQQNSDAAQLGALIARNYPRMWTEKYKKNWSEEMKKAKFTVDIEGRISRVGLVSENIAKRGLHD